MIQILTQRMSLCFILMVILYPRLLSLVSVPTFFIHVFRIHYFESICPRKPRKLDFSVTSGILNKIKSINLLETFFCHISSVLFQAFYQNENLYHSAIQSVLFQPTSVKMLPTVLLVLSLFRYLPLLFDLGVLHFLFFYIYRRFTCQVLFQKNPKLFFFFSGQ